MRFHIGVSFRFKKYKKIILYILFSMLCFFLIDKVFAKQIEKSNDFTFIIDEIDFNSYNFAKTESGRDITMQDVLDYFSNYDVSNSNYNLIVEYELLSLEKQEIIVKAVPKDFEVITSLYITPSNLEEPATSYDFDYYYSPRRTNNVYELRMFNGDYDLYNNVDFKKFINYIKGDEYLDRYCTIEEPVKLCSSDFVFDFILNYQNFQLSILDSSLSVDVDRYWLYSSTFKIPYKRFVDDEDFQESIDGTYKKYVDQYFLKIYVISSKKVEIMTDYWITYLDLHNKSGTDEPVQPNVGEQINDNIMDDTPPDVDNFLNDIEISENSAISDLVLLPINFYKTILDNFSISCRPYVLPFGLTGGNETITLPCINLKERLGATLWNLIDAMFCIFMIIEIARLLVTSFEDVTSLHDTFGDLYEPKHAEKGKHGERGD